MRWGVITESTEYLASGKIGVAGAIEENADMSKDLVNVFPCVPSDKGSKVSSMVVSVRLSNCTDSFRGLAKSRQRLWVLSHLRIGCRGISGIYPVEA